MKLKKGFVLKKTAGRYVAVSMGDDYNGFMGMVTLSGTAPFYWELLKSEQTLDFLAESVTKEYDVTKEEAIKDLKPFIKKLLDAGILEE